MSRPPLPNHPFKAVFYVVILLIGLLVALSGSITGHWLVIALGVLTVVFGVGGLAMINRGRNPRWFESPLDRRRASGRR